MGCDHTFLIISAAKYLKFLRPKLHQYYGKINYKAAIREDHRKVRYHNFQKMFFSRNLVLNDNDKKGPVQKYIKKTKFGNRSQELYDEMRKFMEQNSTEIESVRNGFLRSEDFLQEIESFEDFGFRLKVSNIVQVENFLKYMQVCKQALQKENDCEYNSEYEGVKEAQQTFNQILNQMRKHQTETYLIFQSG